MEFLLTLNLEELKSSRFFVFLDHCASHHFVWLVLQIHCVATAVIPLEVFFPGLVQVFLIIVIPGFISVIKSATSSFRVVLRPSLLLLAVLCDLDWIRIDLRRLVVRRIDGRGSFS